MWYLKKELQISSAHHLERYSGKCKNVHGHNWKITVYCRGKELDKIGMLIDFGRIKEIVMKLDHGNLNILVPHNPTAENLAKYLQLEIPYCYQVKVEEAPGAEVIYVED